MFHLRANTIVFSAVLFSSILLSSIHSLAAQETEKVEPADVLIRVGVLGSELELIRAETGRPKNAQPEFSVFDAAPRQVYFQAKTLFLKSRRMCFEHTRIRAPDPVEPQEALAPKHVRNMVDAALEYVLRVKQELKIPEQTSAPARDDKATPTDVFQAIVQANRQLNLLLDEPFAPSDVYQQVTTAINYSSNLLKQFPDAERIPPAPEFERKKSPSDVHERLVRCAELALQISKLSGQKTLRLEKNGRSDFAATPGDVYDVATLIVSELAFHHSKLNDPPRIRQAYYPGKKFPTHVFQRAGILEAQLLDLVRRIEQQPDWRNNNGGSRNDD